MKKSLAAIAAAFLLALFGATQFSVAGSKFPVKDPCSKTAAQFKIFSAQVWDLDRWERDKPKKATLAAKHHFLECAAGPGHRRAMVKIWRKDKTAFNIHQAAEEHRVKYTPYYGCTKLGICKWWALPAYIVSCESGGDYTPDSGLTFGGAYGILVSTWLEFGGGKYASQANYAKPKHQDIIAHKVWITVGPSAWACA